MKQRLVGQLMTQRVRTARPGDPVSLVRDLIHEHGVRHVPVVDEEGALVGLVSHRDLLRAALIEQSDSAILAENERLESITVGEVMNTSVDAVEADTPLTEAAELMLENKYGCVPVVSDTQLVGILTESDFVRLVLRELGEA
jgi:CBS domain-containing membrane protein